MPKPKRLVSFKHTLINSIGTFFSRISGIIKWTIINPIFGGELDVFHASFKIINNLRKIVGEGVIANAFIPVFQQKNSEDNAKASLFASNIINIFLLFTIAFCVIAALLMPYIFPLFVPGFEQGSVALEKSIKLAIIMLPFVVFIFLFAVSMGILNSNKRFTTPAFAPILFNLSFILFPLLLHKQIGIYSVGLGVIVGALLMFLIEIFELVKVGFRYHLYLNFKDPSLKDFGKLFFPTAMNMGILMILPIVFVIFVSMLPSDSLTILQSSQVLNQAPVGIIGVAIATVLLPLLSRPEIKDNPSQFQKALGESFFMFFYLMIPIALFIVLFPDIVINIAYRDIVMLFKGNTGKYTIEMFRQNYLVSRIYGLGLPAIALNVIFAKIFYSRHDAKTPLIANIILVGVSCGMYFLSKVPQLGIRGMAIADASAASITAIFYLARLRKITKLGELFKSLIGKLIKITIVSGISGVAIWLLYKHIYLNTNDPLLSLLYGGGAFLLFAGLYYGIGRVFKLELKR